MTKSMSGDRPHDDLVLDADTVEGIRLVEI
eukprot:COSAG01_NODE_437_length_17047_cov_194.928015_10_plen_30_part_00